MRIKRPEPLAAILFAVCVATGTARPDGFQYPLERRGELTASLAVRVEDPDAKPTGSVHLTVTVTGPKTLEAQPARIDDPLEAWAVSRSSSLALDGAQSSWSELVILKQAKPGFVSLPAVRVRFRADPDARWEEAQWSNILNEVVTAPAPEPIPLESSSQSFGPLMAGTMLLGGFLFLGWYLRRKAPRVELTPEEQARREIDAVERAGNVGVSLHAQLADTIRAYLGSRYRLPAMRQTTPEFLAGHINHVPTAARDALIDFLQRCDLAKFAAIEPLPVDCQKTSQLARAILEACEAEVK